MFEQLGYKYYENYNHSGCNSYIKENSALNFDEVEFCLDSETFNITGWTYIDMKLLQAINQQCKELGWIE